MDRRYQVFISSTYQDLKNARHEISQALLRTDCFPAGMELFPAADEEQFSFIKEVIQDSDYYILITAGRYGSIHPKTGLSYTEMEYDFAKSIGKPIIRLLHENPFEKLMGEFIESTDEGRAKLIQFREKLRESSLVRYWGNSEELGKEVVIGLHYLIKKQPMPGWIRASERSSDNSKLDASAISVVNNRTYEVFEIQNEKQGLSTDSNVDVLVPKLGESTFDVEITDFLVEDGERVNEGMPLVELETDKFTFEIPAPASGKFYRSKNVGAKVFQGDFIGIIIDVDEGRF